jgi:hypothetical protein
MPLSARNQLSGTVKSTFAMASPWDQGLRRDPGHMTCAG